MLPIKAIVHPTDFSENSKPAFELACALARDYGAKLHVVHAEPPMPVFAELGAVPPPPVDRRSLERHLAQLRPANVNLDVTRVLLNGDEARAINEYAEKVQADLIVIGTHGRTGFGRLLMGSVAEEVLRHAPCPVVTVKCPIKAKATAPESSPATVTA